jgi:hypothetical protein
MSRNLATFVLAAIAVPFAAATPIAAKPYTTITLPDGGNYEIQLTAPSYSGPSGWRRTENGRLPSLRAGEWVQIMVDGNDGWRNTILKIGSDGKPRTTRHTDRNHHLDAPWRKGHSYQDGWYRVWPSSPPGHPYAESNELLPKALLTIHTNRSKITYKGRNAPAEGLQLYGNDNTVDVDLVGGPKVALETDRAELRIWGDRNKITGTVRTEMVAVRVNGNENELRNMSLYGLEVGNDVGLVVFPGRGFNRNKAIGVLAVCAERKYPVSWVHTGFYLDDRASSNVLQDCRAKGFQSGVFVHGGSDNRIDLTAEYCEVPVFIGPHFSTPNDRPRNPAPTVRSFGQPAADRRVSRFANGGVLSKR